MKKSAIVRICIWSVIALLLTSAMISAIAFAPSTSSIGLFFNYSYEDAKHYTAGNVEFSAETTTIRSLEIDWIQGNVTVRPSKDEIIRVYEEASPSEPENQLHWRMVDDRLLLRFCESRRFFGINIIEEKNLIVELPISMLQEMRDLKLNVVSATVDLQALHASTIDVTTVSGDIKTDDVSCRNFEYEGVSALLSGSLKTDRISLATISGKILLSGEIGTMEGETVSGTVSITSDIPLRAFSFEAVSADITLCCPFDETDGFTVDIEKVSGEFSCDYPTVGKKGHYTYGNGKSEIEIETVSGDCYIRKP